MRVAGADLRGDADDLTQIIDSGAFRDAWFDPSTEADCAAR